MLRGMDPRNTFMSLTDHRIPYYVFYHQLQDLFCELAHHGTAWPGTASAGVTGPVMTGLARHNQCWGDWPSFTATQCHPVMDAIQGPHRSFPFPTSPQNLYTMFCQVSLSPQFMAGLSSKVLRFLSINESGGILTQFPQSTDMRHF